MSVKNTKPLTAWENSKQQRSDVLDCITILYYSTKAFLDQALSQCQSDVKRMIDSLSFEAQVQENVKVMADALMLQLTGELLR